MSGLVLNGGPLRDEITNLMDEACVPVIENPGAAPGLAELIKARTTRIAEVQVSIEQNTDLDRGGRMEVMGDAWRESYDLAVELADG